MSYYVYAYICSDMTQYTYAQHIYIQCFIVQYSIAYYIQFSFKCNISIVEKGKRVGYATL